MFKTVISVLFRLSVAAFLVGGLAMVVLQGAGLVLGDGDFVTTITDRVAPWAYGAAGVAGLLAFALSYFRDPGTDAAEDGVTPRASALAEHA